MGLLKFLLICILILWFVRMMVRFLFPFLMTSFVNKMQNEAQKQYQRQSGSYQEKRSSSRPEGEIRIDYVPPKVKQKKPSTINGKAGDFVDFEEIN